MTVRDLGKGGTGALKVDGKTEDSHRDGAQSGRWPAVERDVQRRD